MLCGNRIVYVDKIPVIDIKMYSVLVAEKFFSIPK